MCNKILIFVQIKLKTMKKSKLTVHLYYEGEHPADTRYTDDIQEARGWVADAKHGEIINQQNIIIQ